MSQKTQFPVSLFVEFQLPDASTPYADAMQYKGLTGKGQPIVADGTLHTLAQYYGTIAAAKADYPNAAALTDSIDAVVLNACITAAQNRPVFVGKGRLVVNLPIIWPQSDLIGAGSGDFRGTELILADGSNCNVIESSNWKSKTDWHHYGHLRNFFINANRISLVSSGSIATGVSYIVADAGGNTHTPGSIVYNGTTYANGNSFVGVNGVTTYSGTGSAWRTNNTSGNCIAVWQMGETAEISMILMKYAADNGILAAGNHAPCRIRNVSAFGCGHYGFNIDASGMGNTTLDGPSGDGNIDGLIYWACASGSIRDLKSEYRHNPVVRVKAGSFVNIIGGTANAYEGPYVGKLSVVEIAGVPGDGYYTHVNIEGIKTYGYNSLLHDAISNTYYKFQDGRTDDGTSTGSATERENLYYGGAQWTRPIYADAGIILTSPDGTRYLVKVANGGSLAVTAT